MPLLVWIALGGLAAGGVGGFVLGGGTNGVGNTVKYVVIGAGGIFVLHQLGILKAK